MLKAIQAEDVIRHNHSYQNPLNDINYQHIVSVTGLRGSHSPC